MRRNLLLLLLLALAVQGVLGQDSRLRKGVAVDGVVLSDSLPGNLALYLPLHFTPVKNSPLLFIAGAEDPLQSIRYFQHVAERNGYILAASKLPGDSISLTEEVVHINKVLYALGNNLPLDPSRIFVSGFGTGGQLASLLPSLIPQISGVLVLGAVPGMEVFKAVNTKPSLLVIMGRGDFGYYDVQLMENRFKRNKIPLAIQYFEGGHQRPSESQLDLGLRSLELQGVKQGRLSRDSTFTGKVFEEYKAVIQDYKDQELWILSHHWAEQGISLFDGLWDITGLKQELKSLERLSAYREQKRWATLYQYKEQTKRLDLTLNLEEDLELLNFDNLGWWNFQMQEFLKLKSSKNNEERVFAGRMEDFTNAMVEDYIRLVQKSNPTDLPALLWLNMLKTLTAPKDYPAYLRVISLATQLGDTGTSLYYLEELLKVGYTDFEKLYTIPDTGLLRVNPEYNSIIFTYLGRSRYPTLEMSEPQ